MELNYQPILLDPADNSTFNPRFLDITDDNPEDGYLLEELDEFGLDIKIFNLGPRYCLIGHRDGSISYLRNTPCGDVATRRCYRQRYLGSDGKRRYQRVMTDKRRASHPPVIEAGIYVCVRKYIRSPQKHAETSTILYGKTEDGRVQLGEKITEMVTKTPQTYEENINPHTGLKERSHRGPSLYNGIEGNKYPQYYETLLTEYFIPYEEIAQSHEGILYIEQFDIALSTTLSPKDFYHPYSSVGKRKMQSSQLEAEHDVEGLTSAGMLIVNVDNRPKTSVSPYYCNLNGCIVRVKPVYRPEQLPGLYIHFNQRCLDKDEKDKEMIFIPQDKIFDHGLPHVPKFYLSYAEASTLGDLEATLKKEEREKELLYQKELAEIKNALEQKKLEIETQKIEVEKAKAIAEEEKQKYEAEKAKRNDYYDQRSSERKESLETLKYVIALGGLAVGLLIGRKL